MSCLDENTAALFMQGGLRGDAARAVELHLDGCRACGALLAEVARIYVSSASSLDHPTSHVRASGPPVAPGALVAPGDSAMAVGRYHLAGVLGAGGMGVVFAAFDPMLQRRVALKLVRPDLEGSSRSDVQVRLVREAQSVARIAHPNVVTVYDVGFVGVHVFFAMELVEGPTFRQWLAQSPRTPRETEACPLPGRAVLSAPALSRLPSPARPQVVPFWVLKAEIATVTSAPASTVEGHRPA